MIQRRNCILVYSEMNTWIDFCILVSNEDFNKTTQIVAKAYDDWWESSDADSLSISEYIGSCLKDNEIKFDIYYNNEDEDDML